MILISAYDEYPHGFDVVVTENGGDEIEVHEALSKADAWAKVDALEEKYIGAAVDVAALGEI